MELYLALLLFLAFLGIFLLLQLQSRKSCPALCHVVCLSGPTARVEQQIHCCLKKQKKHIFCGTLLFVDRGLDPESIMAAQILLARETEAFLCAPEQVLEYINWEIEGIGAGTD